jgi:hypothetical protein
MKPIVFLNGSVNILDFLVICGKALIAANQAEKVLELRAKVNAARSFSEKMAWLNHFCEIRS